jgi:hypothetical protein
MATTIQYQVPERIYRYSTRHWLQRALELGDFQLVPASEYANQDHVSARRDQEINREIRRPDGSVRIWSQGGIEIGPVKNFTVHASTGTDYFMLCFSTWYKDFLFDDFSGSDACLVVHNVPEFSDRIHAAVEQVLPGWIGFDGPVSYGFHSDFGAAFLKPDDYSGQREWRFVWHTPRPVSQLQYKKVYLGNLEDICELVERSHAHT